MNKFTKIQKEEIINNVINGFWKENKRLEHDTYFEYDMADGRQIQIEIYDGNENDPIDTWYGQKGFYYMKIDLYNKDDYRGYGYNKEEYKVGYWWIELDQGYGDINWVKDTTINNFIKKGIKNILKGIEKETEYKEAA